MLAHVTRQKYQPFSKLYVFAFSVLLTLAVVGYVPGLSMFSIRESVMGLTGLVAMLQWVFIMLLIHEVTSILDIRVFVTKQSV